MLGAMAEGHEILTVEGLGDVARSVSANANGATVTDSREVHDLDLVQQAFLAKTGFQCSYCTPGILLTTKALLAEHPRPTTRRFASIWQATCAAAAAT